MHAKSCRVVRTLERVHRIIVAFSTFLAGLYFGATGPPGVDLVLLQLGLVAVVVVLGLANLSAVRHLHVVDEHDEVRIEQRLQRHTSELRIHSDYGTGPDCHLSANTAGSSTQPTHAEFV